MAVGISSGLANGWLNTIRGGAAGTSYTAPSAIYAKLHIGDPGGAGTSNSSAVTTRLAVAFAAASGGSISLTGTPPTFNMTTSETLSHVSFWDASTSGNFLWSAALTSTKAVGNGDTYTLSSDTVSLATIAA